VWGKPEEPEEVPDEKPKKPVQKPNFERSSALYEEEITKNGVVRRDLCCRLDFT
jgi:hypothetical protein